MTGGLYCRRPQAPPEQPPSLDRMVRLVAAFGGLLNRKSHGFLGPQTIWIGFQRGRDFVLTIEVPRALDEAGRG